MKTYQNDNMTGIPLEEFIYTPNGIAQVKDVYEGMPILGGCVKSPYFFDEEVYEIAINHNKIKFRATGKCQLWAIKSSPTRRNQKFT